MFVLTILASDGSVLWTEDYRNLKALHMRAPEAVHELDERFHCYVDDLVMVPVKRTLSTYPQMRSY